MQTPDRISDKSSTLYRLSAGVQRVLLILSVGIVAFGLVMTFSKPTGWGLAVAFAGFVLAIVTRWFRVVGWDNEREAQKSTLGAESRLNPPSTDV